MVEIFSNTYSRKKKKAENVLSTMTMVNYSSDAEQEGGRGKEEGDNRGRKGGEGRN